MKIKVLKQDSNLHERILKAEECLEELGIQITYICADGGLYIKDILSGKSFRMKDTDYTFPRSFETQFILMED